MKMKTKDLVELMDLVSPALAAHKLIPIYTHFWFSGDYLTTYNDKLGMQVPCKTEFTGCVPQEFLQLLKVSAPEKEITLEFHEGDFDVHNGRHIGTFPYIPIDDTAELFTMPEPAGDGTKLNLKELRDVLAAMLLSVSTSTERPEYMGVTIIPSDELWTLYSQNNDALSRGFLPTGKTKFNKRVTVMSEFCNIFLDLTKGMADKKDKPPVKFELNEDYALAQVDDVSLFAKMIEVDQPQSWDKLFRQYFDEEISKKLVPIPDELITLTNRALVVTESDVDQEKSTIKVRDNVLSYLSESKRGVVDDEMKLKHDDVGPVKILSKELKTGLEYYTKMLITKRVVILSNERCVYLIGTTG
jgi:DNA polymerase III sliding clamp (beta) subunit (PCNA family)